jgi:prepilin-type N-terminal cleavage/methylation domain-containing protein
MYITSSVSIKTMTKQYTVHSTQYKAFTLIELLVVISIIGILAAMITVSFTSSQRQARDTQRKSDLTQYRTSLEANANQNNGLYPSHPSSSGVLASETLCTDLNLTSCPEDPKAATDTTGTYVYKYQSNGTGTSAVDGTLYVLWAKLENSTNYWVVCSVGKSGIIAQSTWVNPSGGVCPL